MNKYRLQFPKRRLGDIESIIGPWGHFHSYCWHKAKDKHYPRQSMMGLPSDIVDPVVREELALYNGERDATGIYFKTEEDLAFFLLKWS